MASIRDVAKRAQVAACTVSRVLNNTGYVADETRAKIEKAMADLNYIPNELARSMFRQKVGIIAMLVPDIVHPFFSTLAKYMEEELYLKGYKLMLCSTANNTSREREYMEVFKTNLVDGVILAANTLDQSEYQMFKKPIVMLDRFVSPSIPVVVSDHKKGGELAAKVLKDDGCSHIIHISSEQKIEVLSYESHIVFEDYLLKAKIETKNIPIAWDDFDFYKYVELAKKILMDNPLTDGILAADMVASAFIRAAISLGKEVPKDLKVVAYDGTYATNNSLIPITTIVQQVDMIAQKAVGIMDELLLGKVLENRMEVVDIYVRKGETA